MEIHSPGLDLHQARWNNHVLFMDKVHGHSLRIGACAWNQYTEGGRGALFVDKDQWMQVIKSDGWMQKHIFPCSQIRLGHELEGVHTQSLGAGFEEMIKEYDPEDEVIMLVEHHPGGQLSVYWIELNPGPPDAAARYAARNRS